MSTQDVIAASKKHLLGLGEDIRNRFLAGETWGACAIEADRLWRAATKFQTESLKLRTITQNQRDAAEDNALGLLELKHKALSMPPGNPIPQDERMNVANTLVAPYYWLAEVGSPILYRQADYQDFVRDLTNTPGALLSWTLKQLLATLGLPDWALPVIGVVVVGGTGLWAYNTFLAPVGRPVRLWRKTSRKALGSGF